MSCSLDRLNPLTSAERAILGGIESGDFVILGGDSGPPDAGSDALAVRGEFLRLLLVGGAGTPPLHEKGLRVSGARVTGRFDLEGCRVARDVGLVDCRFDAAPVLRSALVDSLSLDGSILPGLLANRLEARGDVNLRRVVASGPVNLTGARLGGELVCDGAELTVPRELALVCARLEARGGVMLRGTRVRGGIVLSGARIGDDFNLVGAVVERPGEVAVQADGLRCRGDVLLRHGSIRGSARFVSAQVAGDFDLGSGSFIEPGGEAVALMRAVVDGALVLRDGARIEGALRLDGATLGFIADDPGSWPAAGDLLLDRCRYEGFLASPVTATARLDWLARQAPGRWGEEFWPQPYEQLAAVLSDMGHEEDAKRVLMEKERLERHARRLRTLSTPRRAWRHLTDTLLGWTVGYGRKPLRAFAWLAVFWIVGVAVFGTLSAREAFRPNPPVMLRSPEWVLCRFPAGARVFLTSTGGERTGLAAPGQSQMACFRSQPEAWSYPRVNAWMYSLDALLPGVDTGQQDFWVPDVRTRAGLAGRIYLYFQNIAGWALSLLAIAGFSGIVKSR